VTVLCAAVLRAIAIGLAALPAAASAQDSGPITPTVTVTAKKALVVKQLAKTVHDVSNSARAANGTAQDVLQSTPEVSVSADGRIAVKGNTQVTVLVNGKPTSLMSGSGDERAVALQTMSGADIASIEVITNPSAAYNANGGAILNIVLKRNRKPGAHAQVRGSASDHGLWNLGRSGDVTGDKVSVHGDVAYRRDGTLKIRQSTVDWVNPASGQSGQLRQTSEVFVRRIVQSAAFGIDGALSTTDSLSLAARHNERHSRPVFDVLNENRTDAEQTVFHRISTGPNEQSDNSASLSYSRQENGTALKAMIQRSATVGLIDKSYSDVFVAPARATADSHGTSKSARHLSQATLDWSGASDYGQWGLGIDLLDQVDDLYNYQASADPLTGAEIPDPHTTNGYAVKSRLAAAYLTNKLRYGRWEMLLGGRAERMAQRVNPAMGSMQTGRWQAINPSMHLEYAASDTVALTLNYLRSLQRPDARDLNPFTSYVDAQNLSRGNPGLKPQRLSSWEIGTDADGGVLRRNVSMFYRSSRDTVTEARSFADQVLLTSKRNGGRARSVGVTGSLEWTPDPKLRLGMDGGAYRVLFDTPDLTGLVRQGGHAGYIKLRAAYSSGADDVAIDAQSQSSGITPLGRYGATSSVNLSWRRQLSKTLSFTVNANDLFDGSKRSYSTDTNTFRQSGFDHFAVRRIYLGFVKKVD